VDLPARADGDRVADRQAGRDLPVAASSAACAASSSPGPAGRPSAVSTSSRAAAQAGPASNRACELRHRADAPASISRRLSCRQNCPSTQKVQALPAVRADRRVGCCRWPVQVRGLRQPDVGDGWDIVRSPATYMVGEEPGLRGGRAKGKRVVTGIAAEVTEPKGIGRRMALLADGSPPRCIPSSPATSSRARRSSLMPGARDGPGRSRSAPGAHEFGEIAVK
jgi:hypothetical protein